MTDSPAAKYDLVIATNILVYCKDPELLLAMSNIAASLKSGGYFLTNEIRRVMDIYSEAAGLSGIGKWTDALIGGWQHTMILQYSSGLPWNLPGNVVYVKNAAVDTNWHSALVQGVNPCIAKMSDTGTIALQPFSAGVAGCTLTSYNFLELPTYAPARGAPLRTGDIRLAATPQVDMSVGKTFKFTERMSFQFRVEAFNVFNSFWPNTQQFANNPDAATFGQIILGSTGQGSANFPRQVQLGFKFIF